MATMSNKDAKLLLQGILNNNDETVQKVIDACFESSMKKILGTETRNLMESIGETSSKMGIV